MRNTLCLLFCFVPFFLQSQVVATDSVYQYPEQSAHYIDGETALMKYLMEELTFPEVREIYPSSRLYFSFIVEKDGSLSNIDFPKMNLSSEAKSRYVAVFQKMPCWIPATHNEQVVRQRFILPMFIRWAE